MQKELLMSKLKKVNRFFILTTIFNILGCQSNEPINFKKSEDKITFKINSIAFDNKDRHCNVLGETPQHCESEVLYNITLQNKTNENVIISSVNLKIYFTKSESTCAPSYLLVKNQDNFVSLKNKIELRKDSSIEVVAIDRVMNCMSYKDLIREYNLNEKTNTEKLLEVKIKDSYLDFIKFDSIPVFKFCDNMEKLLFKL